MADWTLRRAKLADTDGLIAAVADAYSGYTGRIPDLPPVTEGLADDIRAHDVWVVERDNEILGGAVLIADGSVAKLANVAVRSSAAGQGIGKALISAAQLHAKDAGADRMELVTHTAMPENIRLYSRLGWQETERDGTRVHMSKSL